MDNEFNSSLDNLNDEYISDEYMDSSIDVYSEEQNIQIASENTVPVQPVQIQPQQIVAQPIYTQPIITQPIYTQPIIVPQQIPMEPAYPVYQQQNFLPIDQLKPERWHAHPVLVFFSLLLCFPVGLVLLLFFTRWGFFPKLFLTLFTLICIWFVYEVIAFYSGFDLPSLLNSLLN